MPLRLGSSAPLLPLALAAFVLPPLVACDSDAGGNGAETNATDGMPSVPMSESGATTSAPNVTGNPSMAEPMPTETTPPTGNPTSVPSDDPAPSQGGGGGEPGGPGNGGTNAGGGLAFGGLGGVAVESGGSGGAGMGGAGPAGGGGGAATSGTPIVIVGGFDYGSSSYPLRTYTLDKATGALTQRGADVNVGPNPSYLALGPSGRVLYVANETDDAAGGLSAVTIGADGSLSLLNHQTGSDGGFTYVAVEPNGRYAFGASYNGGSVSVFPIEEDGSLGAELDNVDFGNGAQSHAVGFDASGRYVLVPNKGNDEVAQLVLGDDGSLSDNTPNRIAASSGAGPRHIAVHPNGGFAFVINELDSTITSYALSTDGTLTAGMTVSTLPAGNQGQNSGAHLELSPDGRFLYGSNRGHDSIVVLAVDANTGGLTLIEHEPTRGSTPRGFETDPEGDVLVVANQDSGTLAVFGIVADGTLDPLGDLIDGPPSPAAVQIVYLDE